ncbi:MAG TPA: DUF5680 domain-containing protein [Ktedonobacteraceae bacterium]|jgi:hypothetical protein
MSEPFTHDELIHFLLHAKRQTCAGQGNQAPVAPLLPGARQQEYYEAPFLYRALSFGQASFVGQETVYFRGRPIWAMSYAGGVLPTVVHPEERDRIAVFLQQALQLVTYERPFRGPQRYSTEPYRYLDSTQGDLTRFRGEEIIMRTSERVYDARYAGGLLA